MINAVCKHLRANLCMLVGSQYIKNDLATKFSLVLRIKDKATYSVASLFNLLRCHWCQDADASMVLPSMGAIVSGSGCISDAADYIHLRYNY